MKISFDIDCTPAEARAFFGLPDLTPVHDLYVDKLKAMITDGIGPAEFERISRAWMPGITEGFEQWQKLMMAAMPKGQ